MTTRRSAYEVDRVKNLNVDQELNANSATISPGLCTVLGGLAFNSTALTAIADTPATHVIQVQVGGTSYDLLARLTPILEES